MSSNNIYSVEELLNLTVADLQDPDFGAVVEVVDWDKLTPEIREQCILKLRELKNERDELAQSSAVDANALTDKLNQVDRSRSATPVLPPWDEFDPDPERVEEDRKDEEESHEALIKGNGRPCYPIELGFDVFDNEQYKDILEYWQRERSSGRRVFSAQLFEWEEFRRSQQCDRRKYVRHDWFHKFQEIVRERRRKFGLDGDVHLREQVAEQSKLDDWMEYQNYKLRKYERFEQSLKEVQEELVSTRRALAEEGFSAFEEIEGLEVGRCYSMTLEWGDKEENAKRKQEQAERKLRMAQKRSETAQSEELGKKVGRDRWIDFFVKEVESQRISVDELQRSADEAKRDVEPYNQWMKAKEKVWKEKGWDFWTKEGDRLIELEMNSAEYRTKSDKRQELQKRAHKVDMAHFRAEKELEFAEELLEAARTEDLAPTVERAALIRRTQKEMRFAEFHVEEEKESTKVLDLKTTVISDLGAITRMNKRMKQHNILLGWVEQQRRKLIGDRANAERESGSRRSRRVSSGAHPNLRAEKCTRPQKPSMAKSILDRVDPAKVTKTPKQKRKGRRGTSVLCHTSQAAEKTAEKPNVDINTAEPTSVAAVPVKNGMRARLQPLPSSRVSKPTPKRPIGRHKDTTRLSRTEDRHQLAREEPLHMSTLCKEVIDQSMNTSMQRSTRGSKRSQNLRLGSR